MKLVKLKDKIINLDHVAAVIIQRAQMGPAINLKLVIPGGTNADPASIEIKDEDGAQELLAHLTNTQEIKTLK